MDLTWLHISSPQNILYLWAAGFSLSISPEQGSTLRQVFKNPEKKSSLVKSTAAVGLTKGFQLLEAVGPRAHAMSISNEHSIIAQHHFISCSD